MKRIILILIVIFTTSTLQVVAQETSAPKKIIIIEGKFFGNLPDEMAKMKLSDGMKIFMISTPNGTKAIGMKLQEPLSNKVLRDTIPMAQVPEATELLRRFNETQARMEEANISSNKMEPLLKQGSKFPYFTATDIDGRIWSNADVKGKVMVLNIWFTGCGPCRNEMPELSTWKDEMPDVMFFSSTYESAEVARPVIEKQKFNWIPLVNNNQFSQYIGNNGYPLTVVVDKEGVIAMIEYGSSAAQREALKKMIKSLIE